MASKSSTVIECEDLTKRFRDFWLRPRVTAVNGLSFRVEAGRLFGFLGPNGSGKSTTIKLLLGLLKPCAGQVEVLGERPDSIETKSRIGYLPEETFLYPFLSASETLEYFGRLFNLDRSTRRRRAAELLTMVGLEGVGARRVVEFSKGMQRRLGLAQALINDPELLILDEPTSGLDPVGIHQVKELLIELSRRGKTLLVSSHLLADIEEICDELLILFGGEKIAEGRCDSLLSLESETVLRTESLSANQLASIENELARQGRELIEVGAGRQRLESFFFDLIQRASREGRGTSGAQYQSELAPFLKNSAAQTVNTEVPTAPETTGCQSTRPPTEEV